MSQSAPSPRRILIVDDDPQIRKILERMLTQSPYEIQSAQDGLQALELVEKFRPHLIILDVMMPGLSGMEVCQKIRERFPKEEIQILMLTAKESQPDRRLALETGADDYITKPFHIASLARKIEYALNQQANKSLSS